MSPLDFGGPFLDEKSGFSIATFPFFGFLLKMPQSGLGSMQGKNTVNMPSAVCASSMKKSLDPTPI